MDDLGGTSGDERNIGDGETANSDALSGDLLRSERPTFDDYVVIDEIGHGSFGTVYKCRSNTDRRLVAIKVPRFNTAAVTLFEHELDLLLRLPNYRHVVQVLRGARATFTGGSLPAVVMAWIPNARTIDEYCDHHRLGRRERVALLARVAGGLQHLHEHGVVHLDLKPRNVLVSEDGDPVIVDLGAARERLGTIDAPSVMTIAYASPEQLAGLAPETIDQRSDIYSFGRLMGAVLLGRDANSLPPGASRADAIRLMRNWTIDDYRVRPNWPGGRLGALLESILVRDRADRLLRAHQLATALNAIAQPGLARLSTGMRRIGRLRWFRDAAALAVTSLLGIAIAVGLCWTYASLDIEPRLIYPARAPAMIRDVVLVCLDNEDAIARADDGKRAADTDVDKANRRRMLFSKVIRQAAAGGASATVIDAMLPRNDALAAGTEALSEAMRSTRQEMPTVLGIWRRWTTDIDQSSAAPELAPFAFGFGSFDVMPDTGAGILVPTAILHEDRKPAFHLAVVAVAAHLRADVSVVRSAFPFDAGELRFAASWGRPSHACTLDGAIVVSEADVTDGVFSVGAEPGDRAPLLALDRRNVARLGPEMCTSIDEFLALDAPALTRLVQNRIVLVWNGEDGADRSSFGGNDPNETMPGGWVQAAAIQALLDARAAGPSDRSIMLLVIIAAALGSVAGARYTASALRRASWRSLLWAALPAGVVFVGSTMWILAVARVPDFRAILVLFACMIAALLATIVEYLRIVLPDAPPAGG